jgi:hypothetical protein
VADQPQHVKKLDRSRQDRVPVSAQITGMTLANSNAASVRCMRRDATRAPRSIQTLSFFAAGVPDHGGFARLAWHSANLLKEITPPSPRAISVITPGSITLTPGAAASNTLSKSLVRSPTKHQARPHRTLPNSLHRCVGLPPLFVRQNRPGAVR